VQERIKISDPDMEYYKDLAEMYVGDDVSPDFYGWVFPKCALIRPLPLLFKVYLRLSSLRSLACCAQLLAP
jgi:hypothetical protein